MKMICAVVRSTKVDEVTRRLKSIGVRGCTVFPVRGYGEEWHLYEPMIHGGHHKLEVIVKDDQADRVMKEILECSFTGLEGDGILSVFNLDAVVRIRSKEKLGETKSLSFNQNRPEELLF
jgi:nitrogen regulatory protein PII